MRRLPPDADTEAGSTPATEAAAAPRRPHPGRRSFTRGAALSGLLLTTAGLRSAWAQSTPPGGDPAFPPSGTAPMPMHAEPMREMAGHFAADDAALAQLADRLNRLEEDGLVPADYNIPAAELATSNPAAWHSQLWHAARLALQDLLHGRVRSLPNRPDILRNVAAVPLNPWLTELAASVTPATVIDRAALLPPDAAVLKQALAQARAVVAAGGWPTMPLGDTLNPGMDDAERVPAMRARLAATDPTLAASGSTGTVYDQPLQDAVQRFQQEQGLDADGRVGRQTQLALNRPATVSVRQLAVGLDMLRAAAAPPPGRRVEVNIPEFRLRVFDGSRQILTMKVVVGSVVRQTPPLRIRMIAAQFNPPWGVPVRNATQDLLPRFRRDPRAMMEKGFRVYSYQDGERVEVDPMTINWASLTPEHFPYVIRQDPGAMNALGQIKLIMPNNQDIYLHDTSERGLFAAGYRARSSGCVRMEHPLDMLSLALDGMGWDMARIQRTLDSKQTMTVSLRHPIPVRLYYQTAVVENGAVTLRPDIYGLDAAYARAMQQGQPRVADRG